MEAAIFMVCCVLLVLSVPIAHIIGYMVSRRLDVDAGNAREVMPAMPSAPPLSGKAEKRWDEQIRKLERKLLLQFKDGASNVDAYSLASQHGVDVAVAEATLAKMREEIPCRLRITSQGRMIHDFSADDISQLRSKRRLAWPMQILLFGLGAFANVGAAWPFLSMVAIAVSTLFVMNGGPSEEQLTAGIAGLIATGLVFGTTVIAGFVMHLFLTPMNSGPRLGSVMEGEKAPQRLSQAPRGHSTAADDGIFWLWAADSYSPMNSYSSSSSSWFDGVGSSGGGGFDLDFDGDDVGGILVVIVVVLLLAVIAACLSAIGLWIRGIWRAIKRLDEPQKDLSPTVWVRTADVIDKWERYIPTNDLVIRAIHALKRAFEHRRPQDDDLPARALVLAKFHGGQFSALQLALQEGLDLDEAAEVGARLSGLLGGQILVSDEGELIFSFPKHLLDAVISKPDDDMWSEFITFDQAGRPMRRATQEDRSVPVNLVGLTRGHLQATDRLVAGTYLMSLMGSFALVAAVGEKMLSPWFAIIILLPLIAMALGTASLSAITRYTSKSLAKQGIYRDIRRAAFKTINNALSRRQPRVILDDLVGQIHAVFSPAWSKLKLNDVKREIKAVCIDLELEPDMEYISSNPTSRDVYDLAPLYRKLASSKNVEVVFDDREVILDLDQDEVVFDTQIQHDHVTVLGRI